MENANDHPFKVSIVKDAKMFANSHPFKVSIEGGGGNEGKVVDELPEEGETGYIYLVLKEESEEGNIYDEYMWVLKQDDTYGWEHIGATNEVTITLYDTTGQNTDGAMTQKAVTDALAGASGVTELTAADYNWPADNPTGVALWLLDSGWYTAPGITVFFSRTIGYGVSSNGGELFYVSKATAPTNASRIVKIGVDNTVTVYSTQLDNGSEYSSPTKTVSLVQATGTSTNSVMSQKATTSMIFADPETQYKIKIGAGTSESEGQEGIEIGHYASAAGRSSVALGHNAKANDSYSVAIGYAAGYGGANHNVSIGASAVAEANGAIAIGAGAQATSVGEVNFGSWFTSYGYNSSNYRLLTGLYDPQSAHDAATKGYVDSLVGNVAAALNVINNGGNS